MKYTAAKPETFSLDDSTRAAIEAERQQLEQLNAGMRVSKSDALRVLVRRALDAVQKGA